jgi:hypothetical protein
MCRLLGDDVFAYTEGRCGKVGVPVTAPVEVL